MNEKAWADQFHKKMAHPTGFEPAASAFVAAET
jgi:hypothetical protein